MFASSSTSVLRCRAARCTSVVAFLAAVSACQPRRPAVVGPVIDAEGLAERLEQETSVDEALQINFEWRLNEARQRHGGVGVVRVESPYRARVDLFTDDLESVLSAVLIDGELRLPPGARDDILPPTDLMWGTLGVIRPHDVRLLGGDRLEGDAMRLRYAYDDGTELHYEVSEGTLRSMELVDDGHVVQRVEVDVQDGDRYPMEATYRNMAAFRELTIVRESLEEVPPFDPSIWDLAQ